MTLLLTRDAYRQLADTVPLPGGAIAGTAGGDAAPGTTFETVNPATGEVLARIPVCDKAEIDLAVEKARKALAGWSRLHPRERKKLIRALAQKIRDNAQDIALLESLESGKPIYDCVTIDIPESINFLEWHAEAADKVYGQVAPAGDDTVALVTREPVGVVACVLPWNFPLFCAASKIGPALATGNAVIVKPAEQTNMTTLRIAELALEAGFPPDVLQVVTGPGAITGREIGIHPGIDMVSFTGSVAVGRKFLEYSAQSNMKRIALECGGKNPCIVMEDAENLDVVAHHVVLGALWNAGQNCSAASRLIVQESIKDRLLDRIREKLREWPLGDPLDPASRLGSIVSQEQYDKVVGYIAKAQEEGARVVAGGEGRSQSKGFFVEPTIFDGVGPQMSIAREEVFGPVLAVFSVSTAEEAVELANDTPYGLTASVFTSNIGRAHRMARDIRAGTVTINCYGEGDISTPFGGYKLSGFGVRDLAYDQYTELKTIWSDISER